MLSAGLLAACGGGDSSSTPTDPTTNSASVALSGTAAKGLMANADVTAHAVNADGSIAAAALASTTTDAQGHYALSFTAVKGQPHVVKVTANANTTHLDEVSGQSQALPVGFSMRTLLAPATTDTVTTSASITPFSEMAVAAAEEADGGVTAANAAQAVTTVSQLLGFNPSSVVPTSVNDTDASADQQKLALMLTAVSQLAASDALGCNSGSAGDKTQCVVNALADAASLSTIKLQTGSTDVSAALAGALDAVVADPALVGAANPSIVSAIKTNITCTGSACTAVAASTVTPIEAATTLFTNIKSDWTELFSRGGVSSIATGAANAEAWKFSQAMKGVQVPAEMVLKDAGVLLMAVDLYNDYKSGRESVPDRVRAPDVTANDGMFDYSSFWGVGCSLYQDGNATVLATAPENANFIGCGARYYVTQSVSGSTTTTTEWRHGFTLTPNADGSFGYTTRARQRIRSCTVGSPCTFQNVNLQSAFYAGTVAPTLTGTFGRITAFTIEGELGGAFKSGTTELANDHHSWSLSGTRAIGADNMSSTTFQGELVAFNADGSTAGTLKVSNGSSNETPVWRDQFDNEVEPGSATAVAPFGGTLSGAAMTITWTTPAAEFEGTFSAGDSVWDTSGTRLAPTKVTLAGAFRNIEAGQVTEFLSGRIDATLDGWASYDAQADDSAANHYTVAATFTGKVTAPTRPVLELTASTSLKSHEQDVSAVSLQYRSIVAGAPRTVISLTGLRGSDGVMSFALNEAASNLSLTWSDGASTGNLMQGSTLVGTIDENTKMLTFTNNEFISLDIGL
ncbi:hypothetical protein [Caldimonas sp. KR1-144]|uniref:hypothetical protein n=1 Tax=Caldimonas sp. KR1-144 TaxID=3400911 RepID=UPI003C04908A